MLDTSSANPAYPHCKIGMQPEAVRSRGRSMDHTGQVCGKDVSNGRSYRHTTSAAQPPPGSHPPPLQPGPALHPPPSFSSQAPQHPAVPSPDGFPGFSVLASQPGEATLAGKLKAAPAGQVSSSEDWNLAPVLFPSVVSAAPVQGLAKLSGKVWSKQLGYSQGLICGEFECKWDVATIN